MLPTMRRGPRTGNNRVQVKVGEDAAEAAAETPGDLFSFSAGRSIKYQDRTAASAVPTTAKNSADGAPKTITRLMIGMCQRYVP